MGNYKYNSYRDTFEEIKDEQSNTTYGTTRTIPYSPPTFVQTYSVVYIADECIDKIADAVIRKLEYCSYAERQEE